MKVKLLFWGVLIVFTTLSCVEPYNGSVTSTAKILTIEGQFTNNPTTNFIKLSESIPNINNGSSIFPAEGAKVYLIEDETSFKTQLIESQPGYFQFSSDLIGKIGKTYHIEMEFGGKKYISSSETLKDASAIENIYYDYDPQGLRILGNYQPSLKIYLDTKDRENSKDYYSWDWNLYEKKNYCASCSGGNFYQPEDHSIMGECSNNPLIQETYDYVCDRPCWEIIKNEGVNTLKDEFSNGKEIKGRLVANIPIYSTEGALIEIYQSTISKSTYDFLRLVQDQSQNTGSLADTPPATLAGNVYEDGDKGKPIAGYVSFKSVATKSFWIDKLKLPKGVEVYGLLDGRKPNPEPSTADYNRPPYVPCLNGPDRTNIKPVDWKD